jgi:hypothetical protein
MFPCVGLAAEFILNINFSSSLTSTRESKKVSALLFFQFIYTKVGVEEVCHFST